jgi:hypothetical protein
VKNATGQKAIEPLVSSILFQGAALSERRRFPEKSRILPNLLITERGPRGSLNRFRLTPIGMPEVLRGRGSVVAAGMARSATLRGMSALARGPIDRCANRLIKCRDFLRYDEYLAKGYPIAIGLICPRLFPKWPDRLGMCPVIRFYFYFWRFRRDILTGINELIDLEFVLFIIKLFVTPAGDK